jgi:hypothetical protein
LLVEEAFVVIFLLGELRVVDVVKVATAFVESFRDGLQGLGH